MAVPGPEAMKFVQHYWDCTPLNGQHLPVANGLVPQDRLDAIKEFKQRRTDDVFVVGYPKAGIHWAMDIATKVLLGGDLDQADQYARPFLELQFPDNIPVPDGKHASARTLADMEELPSPRVIGSHLWYDNLPTTVKEGDSKIIYIWRNMKDNLVSRYNMMKKIFPPKLLPDLDKLINDMLLPTAPLGVWTDHIKSFQREATNPNVLIVSYDDMKEDLLPTVKRIATFLGRDLDGEVLDKINNSCSIEETRKTTPMSAFVGEGVSGKWKSTLSDARSKLIDDFLEKEGLTTVTF